MKKTRCQLNNAVPKSLVILTLLYFCQYDIDLFGLAGTDIGQRDGIPSLVLVLDCAQFFGGRDGLILDAGDNIAWLQTSLVSCTAAGDAENISADRNIVSL